MANLSCVTPDRITAEAEHAVAKKRSLLLLCGTPAVVVLAFVWPVGSAVALALVGIGYLALRPDSTLLAGAAGEALTLDQLAELPANYHVLNQVDIPNERSRTGVNEADLVVVGPDAVFVIEVKHNRGTISGSEAGADWNVDKQGRRGGQYSKSMRNPIAQVKRLVWLLSQQLEGRGPRPWVQGITVFSHPESDLQLAGQTSVPCLRLEELNAFIRNFSQRGGVTTEDALSIVQALKQQASPESEARRRGAHPKLAVPAFLVGACAVAAALLVRFAQHADSPENAAAHEAVQPPIAEQDTIPALEPLVPSTPGGTQLRAPAVPTRSPTGSDQQVSGEDMFSDKIGQSFGADSRRLRDTQQRVRRGGGHEKASSDGH